MNPDKKKTRTKRLGARVTPQTRLLVEGAAKAYDVTVSRFVREASRKEALRVLTNEES